MTEEMCGVCHRPRSEHQLPSIHHEFNAQGKLVPTKRTPPKSPAPQQMPMPLARLTTLLYNKGIITDEELTWVLVGDGPSTTDGRQSGVIGDYLHRRDSATT